MFQIVFWALVLGACITGLMRSFADEFWEAKDRRNSRY